MKNEDVANFAVDNKKLEYQDKAKKLAIKHYKKNKRGILAMPCGTGKTYTSYLISKNFKQIIIVSPLKQFAKQNLDRYVEYGYQHKTLLVDSDGTRDLDKIKTFIKANKSFLISATYDSVDAVYNSLEHMKDPFFIVDEFHNLSKTNVTDENDNFNKLLNTEHKMLFMSATPRVYELENDDDDFNQTMFGDTIYKMSFNEAITNNYTTDYRIWLPSIHEDNSELNNELSVYKIDDVIKSKCVFLLSCLLNNGSRKCIIYCTDKTEITNMKKAIKSLDKYYYMDLNISQITSDDNLKTRTKILNEFAKSTKIELLFSVRILDECIDIPSCDSIFITYPSQSKIRTIQRLSRCIRIDTKNKFKVGNVFIWCNDYDKILETLGGIKEYDENFSEKIKINRVNQHNKDDVKEYNNDVEIVKKHVVGIKEYHCVTWKDKLVILKQCIDALHKRPSPTDKDNNTKKIGVWACAQVTLYNQKAHIMANENVRKQWSEFINSEKYSIYFGSDVQKWFGNLEVLKCDMDQHHKRPIKRYKIGLWFDAQMTLYQNKTEIMLTNIEVYTAWTEFINNDKYKRYIYYEEYEWRDQLKSAIDFIQNNNKPPSHGDKNKEIRKLGEWLHRAIIYFYKKESIMKNERIFEEFKNFMNEYKEYFLTDIEIWIKNLEKVKTYITKNKRKPSINDKNNDGTKEMAQWIYDQVKNNKKQKMTEETLRLWLEFINSNEYVQYFTPKINKYYQSKKSKNITVKL
jgi:superfamily II DNA or RNA helicase